MDTNKMREQISREFDAWVDGYEKGREANGWMPLEPFVRKHMRNAFVASREAVVVELPKAYESAPPYASYQGGWNDMRVEVVDAIEAAGLKVTP